MNKFKIAIAGIGGVGGFFGGKLASRYFNSDEVEIYFISRGENLKTIKQNGLHIETPHETFIAHPKLATADIADIGTIDVLICSMKSYDLVAAIEQLRPGISKQTAILPLLNGIDSYEKLQQAFPQNEIWKCCVYVVSRLVAPGMIKRSGPNDMIYFGCDDCDREKLLKTESIFKAAGFRGEVHENIEQTIWEKLIFISPLATLTSYYNTGIGNILSNEASFHHLNLLLTEIIAIAKAKGIKLPDDIFEKTINKMRILPPANTSSMHSDFQKGKNTEVNSLTGYVTQLGGQVNVPTPTYEILYQNLKLLKASP